MRNLIKKILFEEFHNPKIFLEEISLRELNSYLILSESDATISVDPVKEDVVYDLINQYYNVTNNKTGDRAYRDKQTSITLQVEPTKHWLQRLDRTKEDEYENHPTIIDPTTNEGIDLIFKLKDDIIKKISSFDWGKRVLCLKLITNNNGKIYTNLIKIKKDSYTKGNFIINMITNLKGEPLNRKEYSDCISMKY
jgi:hypothetical protein